MTRSADDVIGCDVTTSVVLDDVTESRVDVTVVCAPTATDEAVSDVNNNNNIDNSRQSVA